METSKAIARRPQKLHLLEALRGLAAFYVFIGHLARQCLPHTPAALRFILGFGQEAVMLFFLLSGFVIYYSCRNRPGMTFKEYFARRFARIYPIFILGLVLAYAASCLAAGKWLGPEIRDLAGNVFMLQDNTGANRPGTWFSPYMGNFSLWSLSYEWWYYMLFFFIHFKVDAKWRLPGVAALSVGGTISMFFIPNTASQILSYFILWWCGAELAKAYIEKGWPTFRSQAPSLGTLAVCLAIRTPRGVLHSFAEGLHGYHPYVEFWNLSAGLAIVIVALSLGRSGCKYLGRLVSPFAWIAPCSYGLYVVHGPIVFHGDWLAFVRLAYVKVILYVALVVGVAFLAEGLYQRFMSGIILRLLNGRPESRASVNA